MPKFDVFVKDKKVKVQKNDSVLPSSIENFQYVGNLIGSTKMNALTQAKAKVKAGFFKTPVQENKASMIDLNKSMSIPEKKKRGNDKSYIITDFDGVLDDPSVKQSVPYNFNEVVNTYLGSIACPHKMYLLAKLAIETNSNIVLSSTYRTADPCMDIVIRKALHRSGIEEYVAFSKKYKYELRELCVEPNTKYNQKSRSEQIQDYVDFMKLDKFVVFEDRERIDSELNPVYTASSVGLTQEHIDKAKEYLIS